MPVLAPGGPGDLYPASLLPGLREIGTWPLQTWQCAPRTGWTTQAEEPKAAAINAQRAGDIVTRAGQGCQPRLLCLISRLLVRPTNGSGQRVWPPGPLVEKDPSTGTWQMLVPRTETSCNVFWYQRSCEPHRLGRWACRRMPGTMPGTSGVPAAAAVAASGSCSTLTGSHIRHETQMRFSSLQTHVSAWLLTSLLVWSSTGTAAQAPTEDSLWYYEIGGAEPVSRAGQPFGGVWSRWVDRLSWSQLHSCGKFDPVAAVTNTLNDIRTGADNMMSAMTAAASAAIAAHSRH